MARLKLVKKTDSLYGGRDPRDIPAYPIREAVRYLRVPYGNLYRWCFGYRPKHSLTKIEPIISVSNPPYLSFWNLAEVYILAGILKEGVSPNSARRGMEYVELKYKRERPLLTQTFETDGIDLFVAEVENQQPELHIINASKGGQLTIKSVMQDALKRVARDYNGLIKALYPYTNTSDEDRVVEIDPRRAFGRPVIVGTRVPTDTIASRWRAGDTIESLSVDFEVSKPMIESALRWENARWQNAAA